MAQKKQSKPRCNVATAVGPTQIIVVDFAFASGLTMALRNLEYGNPGRAYEFLSWIHDSLVDQDSTNPQVAVPKDEE